ncbi:MAG TPA: RagB/SusD family nutrient uptake outer membrane protein [Gemmatimonadaceae bacterium]|nr:RagB/SusD family nutrient uptake outer membrane protein [Gemmatimonadaceae bacterium]
MRNRLTKASNAAALGALLLFLVPTACDTLDNPLDVESASRIPADQIETPGNALLLSNGAIGDLECAFNAYVVLGGLVGEELIDATQTANRFPYDSRNTVPTDSRYSTGGCTTLGVYTPLQTARSSNDNMLTRLKSWSDVDVAAGPGRPNRTNLIGIAAAYSGYAYLLLGEGFCTMALSTINPDRTVEYGAEIQRDSVFRAAEARFSEAITAATAAGNNDIRNMALVGRARARLNLANYAGARADAAQVPVAYNKVVTASTASDRRQNRVYNENSDASSSTSVGLPYRNLNDPRVPVVNTANRSTTGVTLSYQTKYVAATSSIPLATYEEAQLIIAEADIRSGNLANALLILNAERVRGNQGAFTGVTQAAYLAELIDQRRRELFLESHHLGDLIRLGISPQPAAGTAYHGGGAYGNQVCLPLPSIERLNNPRIGG